MPTRSVGASPSSSSAAGALGSAWGRSLSALPPTARRAPPYRPEFLRRCAGTLAGGLRRYNVLVSPATPEFVVLLPDIAVTGTGGAGRLGRALAAECPAAQKIALCFAVARLDVVDVARPTFWRCSARACAQRATAPSPSSG